MFKRTPLALLRNPPGCWVGLFSLAMSSCACAQQPVSWPWQPLQLWVVPANGQIPPFPTPFWLWGAAPASAMPSLVPPLADPVPDQVAVPATTPAPELLPGNPPLQEAAKVAVPAEPPGDKGIVIPTHSAAPAEASAVLALPKAGPPAAAKATPALKKSVKRPTKAPARKARKLCFKDGKLDICP